MKFRPAAEVKLEDIVGSYELLDYTDYENAKTYNINQMENTGLPLWVMSLTIRADATTGLTICSKEGQIVNRETVAVETGPTYYVDYGVSGRQLTHDSIKYLARRIAELSHDEISIKELNEKTKNRLTISNPKTCEKSESHFRLIGRSSVSRASPTG